jgi:hypothetical protein
MSFFCANYLEDTPLQNYHSQDAGERYGDYDQDEPTFQPLKKQTGKAPTLKGDRRQIAKEWGRSMHKYHKQREKTGKP